MVFRLLYINDPSAASANGLSLIGGTLQPKMI